MNQLKWLFLGLLFSSHVSAANLVQICPQWLSIHYETFEPFEGPTKADILYLTGFGDRLENHKELFDQWRAAGYRVISFSFPKHGLSTGLRPLSTFTFRGLAKLAAQVEKATLQDPSRPLIISGWSTGGLLATRWLQSRSFPRLSRQIAGAVLFAPGISVYNLVGEWGTVTQASLTNNPAPGWIGEPTPSSPLKAIPFALFLKTNSWLAQWQNLPKEIPIFCILGDHDYDRYVKINDVRAYFENQADAGASVHVDSFERMFHAVDIDPEMGEEVRAKAIQFTRWIRQGLTSP